MRQCEGLPYGGVIAAAAETLDQMGAEERGSVLSFARRNTAFLDSPRMVKVLASSSFSLDELKLSPQGLTLYLCLPVKPLVARSRWLRLLVVQAMA